MNIGEGEMVGEDYACFYKNNGYSVKVESINVKVMQIDSLDFIKKFKKAMAGIQEYFVER